MAELPLPPIDETILSEAYFVARTACLEKNPVIKALLEQQALQLWVRAHQARRDAQYARGRQ